MLRVGSLGVGGIYLVCQARRGGISVQAMLCLRVCPIVGRMSRNPSLSPVV